MKALIALFVISSMCFPMMEEVERVIEKDKEFKNREVKGLIIQQRLLPPEELFSEKSTEETTEETGPSEEPPIYETPSAPQGQYVSYERYMDDVIELNTKLAKIEEGMNGLAEAISNTQDASISNREFTLKFVEIIIYGILGVSGGGGLLGYFLRKKKKNVPS